MGAKSEKQIRVQRRARKRVPFGVIEGSQLLLDHNDLADLFDSCAYSKGLQIIPLILYRPLNE